MPRARHSFRAILLFYFPLVILQPGCAGHRSSARPASSEKLYAVTAETTAFYHVSPRQGNGPDKSIPRDTEMKLIRRSSGFCKVQLVGGEIGFVANDDIGPASGRLIASNNTPPKKPMSGPADWRAEIPAPRPSAPEMPLPEFEPTPIASPSSDGH